MKRIIISLVIIGVIVAVGVFSCAVVASKNSKLYGHIESVVSEYGSDGDTEAAIAELERFFSEDYAPPLSAIVNDEMLSELATVIYRLRPMLESGCDEFTAECEAIKTGAAKILRSEMPSLSRIL